MPSNRVDIVAMLLSTDWFAPHWSLVGIYVKDSEASRLRMRLRQLVKEFTNCVEQYWNIDFSDPRIQSTLAGFQSALTENQMSPSARGRIFELVLQEQSAPPDEGMQWLVVALTDQVFRSPASEVEALPPHTLNVLRVIIEKWRQQQDDQIDLVTLCLQSATSWDKYTRGLTPDLPPMLAHEASNIVSSSRFAMLVGGDPDSAEHATETGTD